MTGMSAKDRIPLLERELLRIQNELAAASAEAANTAEFRAGLERAAAMLRSAGYHLAADWLETELGD